MATEYPFSKESDIGYRQGGVIGVGRKQHNSQRGSHGGSENNVEVKRKITSLYATGNPDGQIIQVGQTQTV